MKIPPSVNAVSVAVFCVALLTSCTPEPVPANFEIQGHRGARGLFPENSIPAVVGAIDLGVDTIELDAVISLDSQVVVSHEPWMSPAICSTPEGHPIGPEDVNRYNLALMPYALIRMFDCGQRGHTDFPDQIKLATSKPLLVDAIRAARSHRESLGAGPVGFNIEIKSGPENDGIYYPTFEIYADRVIDAVRHAGGFEMTTIQSFDVRPLRYLHETNPSVPLSLLVSSAEHPFDKITLLGFDPAVLSPHYSLVTSDLLAAAHARGIRVIPWTVNDLVTIESLKKLGADGVISDYPDRALRAKREDFLP